MSALSTVSAVIEIVIGMGQEVIRHLTVSCNGAGSEVDGSYKAGSETLLSWKHSTSV